MTATSTSALITQNISDYGTAVYSILGAFLVIAVGYLVFKFGWRKTRGVVH